MSASKLLQTSSLLLAKASTNSEFSNSQKLPVENSTLSEYAPACSIQRLAELQAPGTGRQVAGGGRREAGGRWRVAGGGWRRPKS